MEKARISNADPNCYTLDPFARKKHPMIFRSFKIDVAAYDDGSGYKAAVEIDSALRVTIRQGDHLILLDRIDWHEVKDTIDKMYDALDDTLHRCPQEREQ